MIKPRILLFILACLTISSCASKSQQMYVGEPLPPNQTATIHGIGIAILKIDGKDVGFNFSQPEFEVLPGRHNVYFGKAGAYAGATPKFHNVSFDAKPSITYFVGISTETGRPQVLDLFGNRVF